MLTVTIESSNGISRSVAVEAINGQGTPTSYSDIASLDAVVDFFDSEPAEIKAAISDINGDAVPESDRLRASLLGCAVSDGDVISVDLEADEEEEAAANEASNGTAGTQGIVTVLSSGGINEARVHIINGQTSVFDAIHNGFVRERCGMSEDQITASAVYVNDQAVSADALKTTVLHDGDSVMLGIRKAHTNGIIG